MNHEETLALYARGKDAWNAWAKTRLAERKSLEAAGKWAATKHAIGTLEPHNDETRGWMADAEARFKTSESKHSFEQDVNCTGWIFPGDAWFRGATFSGDVRFEGATFAGAARFEGATFTGDAWFRGATFTGDAWFRAATFANAALFGGATFTGDAWFMGATFVDAARYEGVTIAGTAWFGEATFAGDAQFEGATFTGDALFDNTKFMSDARFGVATFNRDTSFSRSRFMCTASFEKVTFSGDAIFHNVTFARDAIFGAAAFARDARFKEAEFHRDAGFGRAKFNGYTDFSETTFSSTASFSGADSKTAFTLRGASFKEVPDFIQANFVQAPRLDNMTLPAKLAVDKSTDDAEVVAQAKRTQGKIDQRRDITVRYRALKRLALQGHDLEREQAYFAGEMRSARFATDWPFPKPLLKAEGWMSFWRFWFGLAYEALSNFGRSIWRPLLFWAALLVFSAAIYLGANPEITARRQALLADGQTWGVTAYIVSTLEAWRRNQSCAPDSDAARSVPPSVRGATSAVNEALQLAFANGAVLGDIGSPDIATRTFGCLYGLARSGEGVPATMAPYPVIVSTMIKVQKTFSALLIFLFGLAVRNMLKMK